MIGYDLTALQNIDQFSNITTSHLFNVYQRLGGHFTSKRSDWIWSVFQEKRTRVTVASADDFLLATTDTTTRAAELQHTRKLANAQIVAGLGHVEATDTFPIEGGDTKKTATTMYLYSQWAAGSLPVTVLLGLSYDRFRLKDSIFDAPIPRPGWVPASGSRRRGVSRKMSLRPESSCRIGETRSSQVLD